MFEVYFDGSLIGSFPTSEEAETYAQHVAEYDRMPRSRYIIIVTESTGLQPPYHHSDGMPYRTAADLRAAE